MFGYTELVLNVFLIKQTFEVENHLQSPTRHLDFVPCGYITSVGNGKLLIHLPTVPSAFIPCLCARKVNADFKTYLIN